MVGQMDYFILVDVESEMVLLWINDGWSIRISKDEIILELVIRSSNLKKRMR